MITSVVAEATVDTLMIKVDLEIDIVVKEALAQIIKKETDIDPGPDRDQDQDLEMIEEEVDPEHHIPEIVDIRLYSTSVFRNGNIQ